jgi:hypothetical protein
MAMVVDGKKVRVDVFTDTFEKVLSRIKKTKASATTEVIP